ncbi:hypothetical protein R6Q57_025876 [Mikania cordata]
MDSDRPPPPHRTTASTSSTADLFICFTSMKISSKSILSPGRAGGRDPPFSLTTSLSRRLRTNRSIKGGASPAMFPSTGKKRSGGGFENQEPSSPKVTCIGQVRIKSKKKHGKRLRSLSRRHSIGDVSFRKLENLPEHRNNQRWVHLPLTICEALRAFGSEFSCLFPCRSSCFSPAADREKVENTGDRRSSGSCAAVFTRWLVAFPDGDDAGRDSRRDFELVVEDEEDGSSRVSRRHVFDDLEIVNDRIQGCIDEARVSICIPPKNALLLMRCRSDPLKMEALANRLWQSTVSHYDEQDDEFIDGEDEIQHEACNPNEFKASHQKDIANHEMHMIQNQEDEKYQETFIKQGVENEYIPETNEENEECTLFGSLFNEFEDQEVDSVTQFAERSESPEKMVAESPATVLSREELPECLLLMMYEPKLSMEVSKETWVSSKDFIRRQSSWKKPPPPPPPPARIKPTAGQPKVSPTVNATATSASKYDTHVPAPVVVQPGRSSCSLPAPSSMAEMLEQKLVNAVGYEPFVLTRCKSEPMRTAAAKLAPDNCFWKNRKMEPLRRASFGVGAAGVGF